MTERRSKYGVRLDAAGKAERTTNWITFASKREAERYRTLVMRQRAGEIGVLVLQPKFQLVVNGVLICRYVADFEYVDLKTMERVVEDAKGVRTREYMMKRKLMKACHGIDIREV